MRVRDTPFLQRKGAILVRRRSIIPKYDNYDREKKKQYGRYLIYEAPKDANIHLYVRDINECREKEW